jgi:hypothetical protein
MDDGGRDAVILLDKNRIDIYASNEVYELDIPENIVRDIDIIDKSGFDSLVDNFIKNKKLGPTALWLVLADGICFSKDITEKDTIKIESEIKDFLDAVPFDRVISKRFKAGNAIRVIAANLEYIEAITEIFERDGFRVEGVVPGAVFPGLSARKVLDTGFARYILGNTGLMRTGNMLTKVALPVTSHEASREAGKKNRLLPFLIGGFLVLLIILVIVIIKGR